MRRLTFKELKDKINNGFYYRQIPDDAIVYLRKREGYEYIEIKDKYDDYILRINYLNEDKIIVPTDPITDILEGDF